MKLFIKADPTPAPEPTLYLDQVIWNEWLVDLEKSFPVGTVHSWEDGKQHMKQGPGLWVEVRGQAATHGPVEMKEKQERRAIERVAREYRALPEETRKSLKRLWVHGMEFGLPKQTVNRHAHKLPGKNKFGETAWQFTPERAALHDKWTRDILATTDAPPLGKGGRPMAVVMMGGGGSGKGTIKAGAVSELGHSEKDFINLDADEVKEKLIPEYAQAMEITTVDGKFVTAKNAAFMAHAESSHVVDHMLEAAIKANKNVIVDGTGGKPERYAKKIAALKASGYTVVMVYAHAEKEEAIKRAMSRSQLTGRFVPLPILNEAHDDIPRNFAYLRGLVDNYVQYYSDLPPVLMQKGPPPKAFDQVKVDAFHQLVTKLGGDYVGTQPVSAPVTGKAGLTMEALNERITKSKPVKEEPIPHFDGRGGVVQVDPDYVEETGKFIDGLRHDIVDGGLQLFGKVAG